MAEVRATYEARRERFDAEARALARRSKRLGDARLTAFLLAAAAFFAPLAGLAPWLSWIAVATFVALFAVLVTLHTRIERARKRAEESRVLQEEALARLDRDWDRVPEPRPPDTPERPPTFVRDLDVFGHASLWKLLGTAATPPGRATLAGWLLEPAPPAEARARQEAVRALAPRLDFRQRLALRARALGALDPHAERFLRWAESPPWLAARPLLRTLAWALPALVFVSFALALAGRAPHQVWLLLVVANLLVAATLARGATAELGKLSAGDGEFLAYAETLELLAADERLATGAPRLAELAGALRGEEGAAHALERLERLVSLAEIRFSSAAHFVLQGLLLWDVHVLARLEAWRRRWGAEARRWLRAVGEIEALCALAGLAHDEPEWAFPELVDADAPTERVVRATALAHPLLPSGVRVANDVTVGPPGTFLLVTGSNMSGKSTLLRAVGSNAVLAQAGGPVCARALRLPPVELGTSILVSDSLEDGVSFFMAELRRVREIVDLAAAARGRGRTLLYLMDEILRGTNVAEHREAVRRVLVHLLDAGAIGAVATHDLALAEIDELAAAGEPVHFRETLGSEDGKPVMSFDYRLRPGLATTRNALKLLELVGLG